MDTIDRIVTYFRSSKAELQKVSWPTKQETVRYSALIIGISIVVALFFLVLDTGLHDGINAILTFRASQTAQTTTQEPVNPITESKQTTQPNATESTASNAAVQTSPLDVQAVTPSGQPATIQVTPVPKK